MQGSYRVTIEKLVFGGQGLARLGEVSNPRHTGKTVFVWNALPGEVVDIEIIKDKKSYLEAIATRIHSSSPDRIEPKEANFLSTSAWQIMSLETEHEWKRAIAAETYSKIGDLIIGKDSLKIEFAGDEYGYRNKIEFSFTSPYQNLRAKTPFRDRSSLPPAPADDPISFAFFKRGGKDRFAVASSALVMPVITIVSGEILAWIRKMKIPARSLKSLIVRANTEGQAVATLFIKDRLTFDEYPSLSTSLIGFELYYSTHKSPASVPTELLYSEGATDLDQDILGTSLTFGALSFFQINPPVFELALKDIAAFVDPKKPLVDFYAGVGAISLPLAKSRAETILVESNEDATAYAKKNIMNNAISGAEVHTLPAEQMTEVLTRERQIILDPPRAGLHIAVVQKLLSVLPERIIYLSCNISTQARDMKLLSEHYRPVFIKLYNFFPRTPHIEGLVVLERV